MAAHDIDPLTGVFTRARLGRRIQEAIDESLRDGHALALLMLDIDYFKSINDAFGHARGDQALVEVVRRIEAAALYRYGGDEFILLLPRTNTSQAALLADRILHAISGSPLAGDPPVILSASIGVGSFPEDSDSPTGLLAVIDRRHYRSKAAGRGRATWQDAEQAPALLAAPPDRLIERDVPLEQLTQFLNRMPEQRSSVCRIVAPPGVGATRFLEEARTRARMQGYATLSLAGEPALRTRALGALVEAQASWPDAELAGGEAPVDAITRQVRRTWLHGLVITVDRGEHLDEASLAAVLGVLTSESLEGVALIVSTASEDDALAGIEVARSERIILAPLSERGVQVWLRHTVGWEAPAPFVAWLAGQTGGAPARLMRGLTWLIDKGVIQPGPDGCEVASAYHQLDLRAAIDRLADPPTNIRVEQRGFVGRAAEIDAVKRHLRQQPITTLIGQSGAGKSRLAAQVAAECRQRYPDGAFVVALDTAASPERAVMAIGEALRLRFSADQPARAQLLGSLRERRSLLVLDSVDHLHGGAALLEEIAAAAPGTRLLATATSHLGLTGEVIVEVRGLPIDGGRPAGSAAAELFLQQARAIKPSFAPTDEDRAQIERICQLVDGLPLGIELAAAWVSSFSCATIARTIERSREFLAAERGDLPAHQRSLHAVFESFWATLGPSERQSVACLAVLPSGAQREACQAVAGASPFLLDALAAKRVLHLADERYTMHALLRAYAAARLAEDPEAAAGARARHADYYLGELRRHEAQFRGDGQAAAMDALAAESDHLRLAWEHVAARRDVAAIDSVLGGIALLLVSRGWFAEGVELLREAADQLAAADPSDAAARQCRARLLTRLGDFHYHAGTYEAGCAVMEEAVGLLDADGDARALAEALKQLAGLRMSLGAYAAARGLMQRALELVEAIDDLGMRFWMLSRLGVACWRAQDDVGARAALEQARAVARATGDPGKLAVSLCNLGDFTLGQEDYADADELLREGLEASRRTGGRTLEAAILEALGRYATQRGAPAEAVAHYRAAFQTLRGVDAPPLVCDLLAGVAELWAAEGRPESAAGLAQVARQAGSARQDTRERASRLLEQLGRRAAEASEAQQWAQLTLGDAQEAAIARLADKD
jgi:diguanylate cyclase (GGDEF)-like protein